MESYHDTQLILMRRSDVQGTQDGGAGGAVRAVCAALRSVCLADDNRPLDVLDGRVPGGRHASTLVLNMVPARAVIAPPLTSEQTVPCSASEVVSMLRLSWQPEGNMSRKRAVECFQDNRKTCTSALLLLLLDRLLSVY